MFISVFCDGASKGNPGKASYGFVIYPCHFVVKDGQLSGVQTETLNPQIIKVYNLSPTQTQLFKYDIEAIYTEYNALGIATNNVAEWQGIAMALEYIQAKFGTDINLQILMDSNLVIQQLAGKWKVKQEHLKPFWQKCKLVTQKLNQVQLHHIYREHNSEADQLANLALGG